MRDFRLCSKLRIISILLQSSYTNAKYIKPTYYITPFAALSLTSFCTKTPSSSQNYGSFVLFSPYSTSSNCRSPIASAPESENFDSDNEKKEDSEDELTDVAEMDLQNEGLVLGVKTVMSILNGTNYSEMRAKLQQCDVRASKELVVNVLSQVRNDWEVAFTFFLWASKQPDYSHSVREYHSMISILGKMRKFDTAWNLIDEMRGVKTGGPSLVTPGTLLIMIRRYCAVHDVGRAISTFYAHKRFKFDVGIEEFHSLLSALCRYKNVQDAEHLLFCNRNTFPFSTKSFNIILNGWCNAISSPREAERIWREMTKRGIQHDVVSYASIISCYSKSSNFYKVLNLFKRMEAIKIAPDRKVYNAVIHALAKGRFVKEAINLMKTMAEKGIAPNIVTYNSLIKPLCKARKIDEARELFGEMLERGLYPTIQTYHAFFRILRTGEEVFEPLEKMRNTGLHPNSDTFVMLIRKFCRWRQLDNVFKLWNEMSEKGISPDRSSYIVLIHGLFLNGKLEEAHKYYIEMKEKNLLPEPNVDEMLQAWVSGKQDAECRMTVMRDVKLSSSKNGKETKVISKKYDQDRDFRLQPETRRVMREKGFSFWEP